MRKKLFAFLLVVIVLMSGCSAQLNINKVETLKGWSFQYNQGSKDYSIFFGLLDKNDTPISAPVNVDIRIENDNNEIVYSGTKSVDDDDFGFYTSKAAGEEYLAEIRIPENEIKEGSSTNGTVYLTIYKDDILSFDEVNCTALYCLPVSDIEVISDPLPLAVNVKGYDGSIESTIQIDGVTYKYEKEITPVLKITVTGTKLKGTPGTYYDVISYKLSDEDGYVIESGNLFLDSLSQGDKFKDDTILIYDIEPGKTYKISFTEYN